MSSLLQNPMFFYGIAFVIFLALAYKYGRKPMLDWIDGEILKIRNELDQARKLRAEAEATLVEYKARQAAAMAEAEAIIAGAKEQAVRLRAQAEAELKESLARHEQQAAGRIRMAEAEAIAEVRAAAIETAMKMARETLASRLDDATASKLIDQAIAEIPASDKKAKAA